MSTVKFTRYGATIAYVPHTLSMSFSIESSVGPWHFSITRDGMVGTIRPNGEAEHTKVEQSVNPDGYLSLRFFKQIVDLLWICPEYVLGYEGMKVWAIRDIRNVFLSEGPKEGEFELTNWRDGE